MVYIFDTTMLTILYNSLLLIIVVFTFHIAGFCPLFILWDHFVLWDFVRRDSVMCDSVPDSKVTPGYNPIATSNSC